MARAADIERIQEALGQLAEAQARTEKALQRLAEAQARTEKRMDRLEKALAHLAEAQARTEQQVKGLAEAQARTEQQVKGLAEAQARTEQQVKGLAEAQARTDEQVKRLAEAQARTEVAVERLAQQVGRLSDTIGFTLEDLARELSPSYLAHHYGIHVPELDRRFFQVDGQELEVDFYGEGQKDSQQVVIVGEVRSRIYGADVEAAVRQTSRLVPQLTGVPVTVLFGFVIHPSAREVADRLGAIVISSSGR